MYLHTNHRKGIMQMFSFVPYYSTTEESEDEFSALLQNRHVHQNNFILEHLQKLWDSLLKRCTSYRADVTLDKIRQTIILKLWFEFLKILCQEDARCGLVNFISRTFESYYKRRFLELANSNVTKLQIDYLHFVRKRKYEGKRNVALSLITSRLEMFHQILKFL